SFGRKALLSAGRKAIFPARSHSWDGRGARMGVKRYIVILLLLAPLSRVEAIEYQATRLFTITNGGPGGIHPFDGIQIAGASNTAGQPHAVVLASPWGAPTDLHPTIYDMSVAVAAHSGRQVGYAYLNNSHPNGGYHAMLWSGTVGSAIDLHPTG